MGLIFLIVVQSSKNIKLGVQIVRFISVTYLGILHNHFPGAVTFQSFCQKNQPLLGLVSEVMER